MAGLYLQDLVVGQIFESDAFELTELGIKDFAAQWDPQPFHLDEDAAQDSFFEGLAGSGWQTACITMRLLVTSSFRPEGGVIGAGIEELKWLRPTRAGDRLRARAEVLDLREMKSKPGMGLARMRVETVDADGRVVQVFVTPLVMRCRG